MKILIAYGTTEGQTRKIARFCADRLIEAGHSVELMRAADAEGLDVGRFDGAILAGSVHIGQYQDDLIRFARGAAETLRLRPTLFLSVSLAAAGDEPDDWKGLQDCVARFCEATGWTPGRVEHIAGAFRFSQYDFFRTWAMRWIAARKGQRVVPGEDREYTDWEALRRLMKAWAESAGRGLSAPAVTARGP